ncbi:MAG: hypothetical protein AAGA56_14210 [Myxococcota bacterium]
MKVEARIGDPEIEALIREHPDVQDLELRDARDASAKGLMRLAELGRLRRLTVSKVKKAVDKAAMAIAEALPLERMELSHCPKLTEKATTAIGKMATLRELDLSYNAGLKGKALEPLAELHMERLSLHGCNNLDDRACNTLNRMGQLVELDIAACQNSTIYDKRITAKTFKLLPSLSHLRVLKAGNNCGVTGKALEPIATMRQLRTLELTHLVRFTAEAWAQLGALTELEELNLFESGPADDVVLAGLSQCASLRRLIITGRQRGPYIKRQPQPYTDAGLEALAGCRALEELTLYCTEGITERGIEGLSRLPRLRMLNAWGCPMHPDALATLTSLEELHLGGEVVTDELLFAAASLPKLERISLLEPGPKLTDEGWAAINHLDVREA